MAEAYDLRSNIKGKPGSQGTLFRVKDKDLLNTERRWPRGYTPERQREVDAALPRVTGIQVPDRSLFNDKTGEFDFDYPHARAVVREGFARSSVPTSDIEGLSRIGPNAPEGRLGEYSPRFKRMDLHYDQPRHQLDQVMVHELGHHVDNRAGGMAGYHETYGPTDYQRGQGEAVADNYMEKHYRAHPRHAKEPINDYAARMGPEKIRTEYPGYTEHRKQTPPLSSGQFSKEVLF